MKKEHAKLVKLLVGAAAIVLLITGGGEHGTYIECIAGGMLVGALLPNWIKSND